ncbi:MAG: PAAR domain-containing protein [Bryobacteraceae bacterium]|nr:PAAR domain-containing protein [Bryobacteraceae bacterium]
MKPQSRLGDRSHVPVDTHFNSCCPHDCIGPAVTGSPNVVVNSQPALRVTDTGVHALCCGPNTWVAVEGSQTVLINNLSAHRLDDLDQHCGGPGQMVDGSPDVLVGG